MAKSNHYLEEMDKKYIKKAHFFPTSGSFSFEAHIVNVGWGDVYNI